MAPHALAPSLIPSGVNTPSAATSINDVDDAGVIANIKSNPFDYTTDPATIRGSTYTSATTVINQAIYSIASKIFSYETLGSDNLIDSHLQLWAKYYHRQNAFGVVPFFHKLQVRSGAANTILGFFGRNGTNGQPITALLGANALNYMLPTLSSKSADSLPLALNISAVDYEDASNSLVSNYAPVLGVARTLGYPVFTPTNSFNGLELQHLTVLNQYVAALTGNPSISLFEGVEFSKNFTKFRNLLSVEELGELYQQLLNNSDTDASSSEDLILYALKKLNTVTGTAYAPFEYVGAARPETVFVVYGANESTRLANVIEKIKDSVKVGLIKIRIPLPFLGAEFARTVPKTVKKLIVVNPVGESNSLKADISTALFLNGIYNRFDLDEFNYSLDFQWTPITITKVLNEYVENLNPNVVLEEPHDTTNDSTSITANSSPEGNFLIWGKDNSEFLSSVKKLALSLSLDDSKVVSVRTKFDNVNGGGLFQSQLISTNSNSPIMNQVDSADVVMIEDTSIFEHYDVLATAKPGATILVGTEKAITEEAFVESLSDDFKRTLAVNKNSLVLIDLSIIADLETLNDSTKGFSKEFLIQLAFWQAAYPQLEGFIVNKLLQANGNGFELLAVVLDKFINAVTEKNGLKAIKIDDKWVTLEINKDDITDLPYFPIESSFYPNPRESVEKGEEAHHTKYVDLATKLTFPEAFGTIKDLRPDLPVKNYVVKVQENIRLTPSDYSRNIFHIEFDISGTGLTYDIGEALGIHGRNHPEDVEEFLKFYDVDGNALVEVSNKDDASIVEIRSARQTLTDTLDFLGKPPKRFYESLAEFATEEKEKQHLTKLASSEGAEELKKRQDVDFCTYFDVLEEFVSARPAFQELVEIISPLKRREYSIASSQRIHENAVHLLIVVVDWTDSKGRKRWGHCSKYLSDLRIGDELVVSVKPSVMKLPPLSTQPIVMSGLGTGLAPFKAFIEEKIWQQQQGMEIGPIYLYMGSRHKKEEYLYGELWEAYKDAGILTHIGAAFSRDQPQKIYIQDKIRESLEDLTDAIVDKNGSFYLCGPTWPVPDITACLEDVIKNAAQKRGEVVKDVGKVIEDMKEAGRYILEVY